MNELQDILRQVADGGLDPDEASRRIDALNAASPSDETGESGERFGFVDQPTAGANAMITRVQIRADGMRVSVIGDPQIATAQVVGPHAARTEDGVLTIGSPELDGGVWRYEGDLGRAIGRLVRAPWGQRVTVRVNPRLPVQVECNAGSLFATGLRAGLDFRAVAGSVKVVDAHGPLNGDVSTGSAYIEALFLEGDSRIQADLGSVTVKVASGSDVRVQAHAEQGSAKVIGGTQAGERHDEATGMVGSGAALLSAEARLGSVKVTLP